MKKYAFLSSLPLLLASFCCVLLTAAGCSLTSATPIQYHSAAPAGKTCTLNIAANFTVRQFDGQAVTWKAGFGDVWAQVQIPEGSHTFVFDYEHAGEAGTVSSYRAGGLSVTYDHFAAGHTYLLAAQPLPGDTRSIRIKVGVKDVTNEPDWGSWSKAFSWTEGFEWLPIK